jgi:AMP deaminase
MYWLGPDYQEPGVAGNDIRRTNVPAIRIAYRYEALWEELRLLGNAYKSRQEVCEKTLDNLELTNLPCALLV